MRRKRARCLLVVATSLCFLEGAKADLVLIACPEPLRPAMASWRRFREAEGHRFEYLPPATPADTATRLEGERVCLLLVGDGDHVGLPPGRIPAEIIRRYGPESEIATDQTLQEKYGADQVARLPFNEGRSLAAYLDRVVQRERRSVDWGETRLQIAAGVGGFSPLIDSAIEGVARRLLEELAPLEAEVSLRRGDSVWRDADSPVRGGVWVWLGHGLRDRLPGAPRGRLVEVARGADVAVLVACYTGDFAADGRCVAEQMLGASDGPLAVIASTRVSMPYGNARLAGELLRGMGEPDRLHAGVLLANARRRSLTVSDTALLASLDPTARLLGANPEQLDAERREHAMMYTLLGDPLLKVRRTSQHDFSAEGEALAGGELAVRGWADEPGELRVELNRDRFVIRGKERRAVSCGWKIDSPGAYRVAVSVPEGWRPGEALLRVGLRSGDGLAVGATTVRVARPLAVATRTATQR